MGEADLTSITNGFIIFAVFMIGAGLFLSSSFNAYDISDSIKLQDDDSNNLNGSIDTLISDLQEAQSTSKIGDDDATDRELEAVTGSISTFAQIKSISAKSKEIFSYTLAELGIPNIIIWGVFAMLSVLITMLIVRIWQKIRP